MIDIWTGPAHCRQVIADLAHTHMIRSRTLYARVFIVPPCQVSICTFNVLPTAREMIEDLHQLPAGSSMSVFRNDGVRKRVLDGVLRRV